MQLDHLKRREFITLVGGGHDHLTAIRRLERAPSTTSIAETTNTAD
jgi:hypothetical protein